MIPAQAGSAFFVYIYWTRRFFSVVVAWSHTNGECLYYRYDQDLVYIEGGRRCAILGFVFAPSA